MLFVLFTSFLFFVNVVAAITAAALATVFAPPLDAALAAGLAAAPAAALLRRNSRLAQVTRYISQ